MSHIEARRSGIYEDVQQLIHLQVELDTALDENT